MKVLAMQREEYIGSACEGHNCEFTYTDQDMVRHYLYLENGGQLYKLTLEDEEGPCGSGYTTANWVNVHLEEVSEVPDSALKCKVNKDFDMVDKEMDTYHNEVFEWNVDGGDHYYPNGQYLVHESLFGKSS